MEQSRKKEIYDYYDRRASEYDEIYTLGKGASIPIPSIYRKEVKEISKLISKYVKDSHIDIACGTSFWLPSYHHRCTGITLIDQSVNMINESKKKVKRLKIEKKVKLICQDINNYRFRENFYDSALMGLLLSHLEDSEIKELFRRLMSALKPTGNIIILDSAWTGERAKFREKVGLQKRHIKDGREFTILKKYFTSKDIESLFEYHNIYPKFIHIGRVFIMGVGTC